MTLEVLPAIAVALAAAVLIAAASCKVIIEIADALHLVYSAEREARREARIEAEYAQRHPPLPAGSYAARGPYPEAVPGPLMRRVLVVNLRRTGP